MYANLVKEITMLRILEATSVDETRKSIDTSDIDANYLSINDATKALNFRHAQYTRRLVHEGKLVALKVQYEHYPKWMISIGSILEYNSNTRRSNGLRRFILKFDLQNEEKVRAALEALEIPFDLELSYQKKSK